MLQYFYVFLLFALFVLPKILQRFKIPGAITCFVLGTVAAANWVYVAQDSTIQFLATLGIVSLFLFAGLDVEMRELAQNRRVLLQHVGIQAAGLAIVTVLGKLVFGLEPRAAVLVGLALVTPSAGFILDSLARYDLSEQARFWIKTKAIASELVALAILFVTLQSESAQSLLGSTLVLAGIVALLPLLFLGFARFVLPHAPRSEFAFVMMLAVSGGVATYQLGVYYLVGAFIVGVVAQRLRQKMPNMDSERMLLTVEAFASLFVPFYFFHAGSKVRPSDLGIASISLGVALFVVGVVVRVVPGWWHRRVVLGETLRETMDVQLPMLPTLVFTLVIAGILRERFGIGDVLFGALITYTILTSIVPGLLLRRPLPEPDEELREDERHTASL